jgi:putative hydrolase of HD superfamily
MINKHTITNFVDKCGQLRFQCRWAQVPRLTKTSVLGHSMMVAVLSYFFARQNDATGKRLYNAFFGGLLHDLPEIVTRDIISPVKRSSGELDILIKELEAELSEKEILPLLDNKWHEELKCFISDEFDNKIIDDNGQLQTKITTDIINEKYNEDKYNVHDGVLIRAADHLSAFMEAWASVEAGLKNEEMHNAAMKLKEYYSTRRKKVGKTSLVEIYDSFK